jgi:hypothetical protein
MTCHGWPEQPGGSMGARIARSKTVATVITALLIALSQSGDCAWTGGPGKELTPPLASGELLIRGATLVISPARQEIDPGRPTVVQTSLSSMSSGQAPAGMRVEGELSGPGLGEPLHLSTVPGEPFQIPGLNREGTYTLGGLRLTRDGIIELEAEPSAVEIVVTRLVIASVTSRPLTPEEIESHGIVIGEDSYSAYRYSVGFSTESGTYEIPFDMVVGQDGITPLPATDPYQLPVPEETRTSFNVPQINTVFIDLPPEVELELRPDSAEEPPPPTIPGFLVIPTDMSFLHQFFSVILVVQNGALAGSELELRNLSAVLEVDSDGLRQAETVPPTIPGSPVPVVDPGPDGEPGTADDLTFLVAQTSGEASWLVEGLAQGQHLVTTHLQGEIHGLASGEPAPIDSQIPGVVLVRDPRFSMTFFHPWTVRAAEQYQLRVVVTNTSVTPVYDLNLRMPGTAISGAMLADSPDVSDPELRVIEELLPGEAKAISWDLISLRTGRVTASAFNASTHIDARFEFTLGVGELGVPLSPESLVLPSDIDLLPSSVTDPALELLGLAYSLATAPEGAEIDLPPIGETIVRIRGRELAAAARRTFFGEPLQRSLVSFGLSWLGTRSWCPSFDHLRRLSYRGGELETGLGGAIAARINELGADLGLSELEEIAITGRPTLLVYARNAGFGGSARLRLVGLGSDTAAFAQSADTDLYQRDLAGAAILDVRAAVDGWSGEIGVVAVPIGDEGDLLETEYQVQLYGTTAGTVELEAVLVTSDGSTRRLVPSAPITTAPASLATLDLSLPDLIAGSGGESPLYIDSNGDELVDSWESLAPETAPAPTPTVIVASLDSVLQPIDGGPFRDILLLLSQPIDTEALEATDPGLWTISHYLEQPDGDSEALIIDRVRSGEYLSSQIDPTMLVLTCSRPLNPHAEISLSTGTEGIPFLGGRRIELIEEVITGNIEELPSGVVRGLVIGSGGEPVAGAVIELYEWLHIPGPNGRWINSLADRTYAGDDGSFLLDAVRFRDDLIPFRYAAFTARATDPVSGHDTVAAARLGDNGSIRDLTLFMLGRGDVVGTLSRADGEPLDQPEVYARSVTNPQEYATATPDETGHFRLTDLPVGSVQIMARDGQIYSYATAVIPGAGEETEVSIVLPEIVAAPLAQIEGVVLDGETTEPIPGVQVFAMPAGSDSPTHMAVTEAAGDFAMEDLPGGMTTFLVFDPVRGRYIGERVLEVIGDRINTVEIIAIDEATGTVSGTIYMQQDGLRVPVAGAQVICSAAGTYAITGTDGTYRLEELPLGELRLEAYDPESGSRGGRDISLVSAGQEVVVDIDLSGQALGRIAGHVIDRDGNYVIGAQVAAEYFGSGYEDSTDGSGLFVIEGLPPDTYDLMVMRGDRLARAKATIRYNGDTAEPLITLGGNVDVEVMSVADTHGGGVTEVLSSFSYKRPGVSINGRIGLLPDDGMFSCTSEDPEAECFIDSNGHAHLSGLAEGVGPVVVWAHNGFYGSASVAEDLDPGDDGKLLTISFNAPARIIGRVVAADGDELVPMAGAVVELYVKGESGGLTSHQLITTDETGSFDFDLLPLGPFSIRAYSAGSGGVGLVEGWLSSGQLVDGLDVVLKGIGGISGEVSICYEKTLLKSGEEVLLTLHPNRMPSPFITGIEIPELAGRQLEVDISSGSAPFVFTNLTAGSWTLRATSSIHGAAAEIVTVAGTGEIAALADSVCLYPTGSISGRIYYPETGEGAASVTVQLLGPDVISQRNQLLTADTTAADGTYSFLELPVNRAYTVTAYDAAANRGGTSSLITLCASSHPGYGTSCFRDAEVDIALGGMGTVQGRLLDGDGAPVSNAFVRLRTSVLVLDDGIVRSSDRELLAFTDAGGGFSFAGVPGGTIEVTAFDPDTPLYVRELVTIDPAVNPVTELELQLPATGGVTVTVLDPFGSQLTDGQPIVVFSQRSSYFFGEPSGSGNSIGHLAEGAEVSFDGLVSCGFNVAACLGAACSSFTPSEIFAHHYLEELGASGSAVMPSPPQDLFLDLQLVARANLLVKVQTAGGEPVVGAEVSVNGSGFYGPFSLLTQTVGADGSADLMTNLGPGVYTIAALLRDDVGNALRGAGTVEISQADHGETIPVLVTIEDAAAAQGRVLTPEGEPAAGAVINMSYDPPGEPRRTFQAFAAADGSFALGALPSGFLYSLVAFESGGLGEYTRQDIPIFPAELDADGVYQLGDLVLDRSNPEVAATDPANGTQNVSQSTLVTIDFSELMRQPSITSGSVRLRREGSGAGLPAALTREDQPDPDGDGPAVAFTQVTLDPGPLASETLYIIDVLEGVEDLGGRTLTFSRYFTFRTEDSVPPSVVAVIPAADPSGRSPVGPDVEPVVSFSEVIDPATVDATTVRLLDVSNQPVTVQLVVERDGFDVRLRPGTGLALDSFYTIAVSGVADTSGNLMAADHTSTFRVRDGEPPVATLLAPLGAMVDGDTWTAVEGKGITLRAVVTSNDAVSSVYFSFDGVQVGGPAVLDTATQEHRLSTGTPVDLEQITISVVAADVSGNLSEVVSHLLLLTSDQPPSGSLALDPAAGILPNHMLKVEVQGQDDFGLSRAEFSLTGALETQQTVTLNGTSTTGEALFRVPVAAAAGAQVVVDGEIVDSLGQRAPLSPEAVTVLADEQAPAVTITAPAPDTTFTANDVIELELELSDNVIVTSAELTIAGTEVPVQISNQQLPGTAWSGRVTTTWVAPEVEAPETISFALTAGDHAGNQVTEQGTFTVQPLVSIYAPQIAMTCPITNSPCAPGVPVKVSFSIHDDDDTVQWYLVTVDDATVFEATNVHQADVSKTVQWIPDQLATPGTTFTMVIAAEDYAGNLNQRTLYFDVPEATFLDAAETPEIGAGFSGQSLILTGGSFTFTAEEPLQLQSMSLLQGVTLIGQDQKPIRITTSGSFALGCGATIDVTGRGYGPYTSYPEEIQPTERDGGSHLGRASYTASTYGSVYRPQEAGSGPGLEGAAGGGVITIIAGSAVIDGSVLANGTGGLAGGAGGSVLIDVTGDLTGNGTIQASGGEGYSNKKSGGGGAVALVYQTLSGSLADQIEARGGDQIWFYNIGGAGTIYLQQLGGLGRLIVDNHGLFDSNASRNGHPTVLPALGHGIAGPETGGHQLATDRSQAIPAYFAGHWVEVSYPDGAPKGTWRIESVDGLIAHLDPESGPASPLPAPDDLWKGAYRFDTVELRNRATLTSDDPIRSHNAEVINSSSAYWVNWDDIDISGDLVIKSGSLRARSIAAKNLSLKSGAGLRHPPTPTEGTAERLEIDLGDTLEVEPGGQINVTGMGYPEHESHPTAIFPAVRDGGCHLGRASYSASTYGSVYRPQEAGAGPGSIGAGGGVVVVRAAKATINGSVLANGTGLSGGGAGGSIWLSITGELGGSGWIQASGGKGHSSEKSGGGGAIALEYQTLTGALADQLEASGGYHHLHYQIGGAGTIYKREAGTLGRLIVDNRGLADTGEGKIGHPTILPALGHGTAGTETGGYRLETDRSEAIPAYFVGHWVEISSPDGTPKGTWRIRSVDGLFADLEPESGPELEPGDIWQGVYRFDAVELRNCATLSSDDPIRSPYAEISTSSYYVEWGSIDIEGGLVIRSGSLRTREITAATLTIMPGAVISHSPTPVDGVAERLDIDLSGDLTVESGGQINVTGMGYPQYESHPTAIFPVERDGGCHLGRASYSASTYGSVYRPQEAGAGPGSVGAGGGVVVVRAATATINGSILANGTGLSGGGAGGSIWLSITGELGGSGSIQASGGKGHSSEKSGGGGAIALEYNTLTGALADQLEASGGYHHLHYQIGGAGTIYKREAEALGRLIVDNKGRADSGAARIGHPTILPALGQGSAGTGTGGYRLETDRSEAIPDYFVGHWVEVSSSDGSPKGTWRIISVDGLFADLEPATGPELEPGDLWQGVYRFDAVELRDTATLSSADPIRSPYAEISTSSYYVDWSSIDFDGELVIKSGSLRSREITAETITVKAGATLSHPKTENDGAGESLLIDLSGNLIVEAGGSIDVSGHGYVQDDTYPGEIPTDSTVQDKDSGSHIGQGSGFATTFGSVYRPREAGGGPATVQTAGGGVIVIEAATVTVEGSIRANGTGAKYRAGGGGGSIAISVTELVGNGSIEASGGDGWYTSRGGGGGAIALEYETLSGAVADKIHAHGGDNNYWYSIGGAGSVYHFDTKPGGSTYGSLFIDNRGNDASSNGTLGRITVLPWLGSGGVLSPGSGELITDRSVPIQPYFVDHWVQVSSSAGMPKGTWRIAAIDGTRVTLAPNGSESIVIDEGDTWQGVYRFDSVQIGGCAHVVINDIDEVGQYDVGSCSTLFQRNLGPPEIDPDSSRISITAADGRYLVAASDGAISDPDGINSSGSLIVGDSSWPVTINDQGGFTAVEVSGAAGAEVVLVVRDRHPISLEAEAVVGTLPFNPDLPLINDAEIVFTADAEGAFHLQGRPGAVYDANPPLLVAVSNDTAQLSWTAAAAADGSFDAIVTLAPGDSFSLTVTDSHPQPGASSLTLVDTEAPVIDATQIETGVGERQLLVSGGGGAIADNRGLAQVALRDPVAGWTSPAEWCAGDGSFAIGAAAGTGAELELVVTDLAGNPTVHLLPAVPANDGPPQLDLGWVSLDTSTGSYDVISSWSTDPCGAPVSSSDGLFSLRLENRTTPIFAPAAATTFEIASCPSLFGFDLLTIEGAVGDQIVIVAEDGHPDWQASEGLVGSLTEIPMAPAVSLGQANLVLDSGTYRLSAAADVIIGDYPPFALWIEVWRASDGVWSQVSTASATVAAGDSLELPLDSVVAAGDLVVVWVTDSGDPAATQTVRVGLLPGPLPLVSFTAAEHTVSESGTEAVIMVTVSSAPGTTASIDYETVDGSATAHQDYLPASGTLHFDPSTTVQSFTITIYNDDLVTGDRNLSLVLRNPSGLALGLPATAQVTILEDDSTKIRVPVKARRSGK